MYNIKLISINFNALITCYDLVLCGILNACAMYTSVETLIETALCSSTALRIHVIRINNLYRHNSQQHNDITLNE